VAYTEGSHLVSSMRPPIHSIVAIHCIDVALGPIVPAALFVFFLRGRWLSLPALS